MVKKETKKGFVWYALRVSFWTIIILSVFITVSIGLYGGQLGSRGIGMILFFLLPFNTVISIIHLFKYKEKPLAIVSLIISISEIVFLAIGILGLMALS